MFLVSYDGSYLGRNIFVPNFVPQVEKKTVTYHCRSSNEKVLALPPCTEFRKIQNTHKMVGNPIGILYYFFPLFFLFIKIISSIVGSVSGQSIVLLVRK